MLAALSSLVLTLGKWRQSGEIANPRKILLIIHLPIQTNIHVLRPQVPARGQQAFPVVCHVRG